MTPAQTAAARTAHTEAVADLEWHNSHAPNPVWTETERAETFMRHTEVLAGHLATALTDDPFDPLTDAQKAARASAQEIVERANAVLASTGTDKRLVLTFDPPADPFDGLAGNPAAVGASEPPPDRLTR